MALLQILRPTLPILIGASLMLTLSMGLRQSFGIFMQPLTQDIGISVSQFTLALAVQKYNEIWSEGHAELLITDDKGRRLGYENGKLYKEIPDSSFIASRSADLWASDTPPVYRIPQGIAFTITVDGSKLKKDEATSTVCLLA